MLEALFVAVAQVVIDKAIDFFEVGDRLRQWLGRDPIQLGFRKALARAYTAFARQYPDLTSSLFTEPFLKNEAAAEIAKLLRRDGHPDPTTFAALWVSTERHHVHGPLLVAAPPGPEHPGTPRFGVFRATFKEVSKANPRSWRCRPHRISLTGSKPS